MADTPLPLAFSELGEGPPLLILHGLFGSGTNWRGIARRLAQSHHVLLVDARNHGTSPHAPSMQYAQMAGDVRALMDAQGIRQATVMGHSMGGKTAMTLALQCPERVARLVVVDIAPRPSPGDHAPLIAAMRSLHLAAPMRRADADRALAEHVADAALRSFLLQNLVADGEHLRWRINLDAIEASMPALLGFGDIAAGAVYPGPALFIRGDRSDYLQPSDLEAIHAIFPAARLATIADSGHWVHADKPHEFIETLLAFLRDGDA